MTKKQRIAVIRQIRRDERMAWETRIRQGNERASTIDFAIRHSKLLRLPCRSIMPWRLPRIERPFTTREARAVYGDYHRIGLYCFTGSFHGGETTIWHELHRPWVLQVRKRHACDVRMSLRAQGLSRT